MIDYLPLFMRKSKVYQEIFYADEQQFNQLNAAIQDIYTQLNIDTATWGLAIYESDLKIPTDLNKPIEDRRSVIKSRLRGSGKVGASQIKLVSDAYTNGDVGVSFDSHIVITFTSVYGIPPNLDDLKAVLGDIKPAHLRIDYVFLYVTYNELKTQFSTYNDVAASGKTYDDLLNGR